MCMASVTREQVLGVIDGLGLDWTTREIAETLGVREYQVRSCVAWLLLGGVIRVAGVMRRTDCSGRPYRVTRYARVHGPVIQRVPRDPDRRREVRHPAPFVSDWLSRAW
jgi:hypothetical protein